MAVNQGLIGNTSQFMVDETGKRVILDLSHCVCCDQTVEGVCGTCTDAIEGSELTIDLGVTAFVGFDGYYSDCETPCNDLEGEIVLNRLGTVCHWEFDYDPFCTWILGIFWAVHFRAVIVWRGSVSFFIVQSWTIYDRSSIGPGVEYPRLQVMFVQWELELGTETCNNKTFTLNRVRQDRITYEEIDETTFIPCYTSDPDWDWPLTIDVIT